jgi:hypothetical protein
MAVACQVNYGSLLLAYNQVMSYVLSHVIFKLIRLSCVRNPRENRCSEALKVKEINGGLTTYGRAYCIRHTKQFAHLGNAKTIQWHEPPSEDKIAPWAHAYTFTNRMFYLEKSYHQLASKHA